MVPVVAAEVEEEDVDEEVEVVREEVEIFIPCSSIVSSDTLNQELLARNEVSPCLNNKKLN